MIHVGGDWVLRGTVGHTRFTARSGADALGPRQEGLRRPQATMATLIPIRKTDARWSLALDERCAILGERPHHIGIGMAALPAVA